ncbi:MAG: DMT family transporter [Candidatus Woesearchaeota archaeon]
MWVLFGLLTAFFDSLKDVAGKRGLRNADEYLISWAWRFFALIFLLPLLFFTGIPKIGSSFWAALAVEGVFITIATVLYVKALKHSDLSITLPMLAFTPLFLLITSPIMLGEFPSAIGLIGILLIICGSYTLNIKERKNGYLAPFKALLREKGPKLMLIVAACWSITANIDKIGIRNSSPIFWSISLAAFSSLALFPTILFGREKRLMQIPSKIHALLPIGLASALTLVFQMYAISMALVPYVVSLKRTSILMGVVFGRLIFKEKETRNRFIGAAIMVAGVILITLA